MAIAHTGELKMDVKTQECTVKKSFKIPKV
jgi:hypothetical protein